MKKTKIRPLQSYQINLLNRCNNDIKYTQLFFAIITATFFTLKCFAVSCSITTKSISFGAYNVYTPTNPGSTGQITVTCNPLTTSYTVALNGGLYGTISQRKLKLGSGTDNLLYNLYTDAARTIVWGDGTSSNGVTVSSSNSTPLTVYGGITPLQDVSVGTYSDSVGITVTF